MSGEFEKFIYAIIGGVISLLMANIVKWIVDKKEMRRVKTAEYFSSLSKYVDYLITVTFYPKSHLEKNYQQVFLHLESLKSQLIEAQCLLVAYNNTSYLKTKNLVKQAIEIDGEFTELILTNKDAQCLNDKATQLIEKVQVLLGTTGLN